MKYSYPKTYRGYRLGSISKTKTRYDKIKSYPENTDVVVNYVFENKYPSSRGGSAMTDSRSVSIKVQHSLVELPDSNYVPKKMIQELVFQYSDKPHDKYRSSKL